MLLSRPSKPSGLGQASASVEGRECGDKQHAAEIPDRPRLARLGEGLKDKPEFCEEFHEGLANSTGGETHRRRLELRNKARGSDTLRDFRPVSGEDLGRCVKTWEYL